MGARRVRLELRRVDQGAAQVEIGLARPMNDVARIAALFVKGVDKIEAGFGIDALRLTSPMIEPLAPEQISAHHRVQGQDALADLLSSLGNRIGFDHVLRFLPAQSLIPERGYLVAPAAYSVPEPMPPQTGPQRPITLFPPEAVTGASGNPPARFRWRRMHFTTLRATGPERITPEWWFDDPAWRDGLRDYWRIETGQGPRLWLFSTPQTAQGSPNWYVQGEFA